MIHIISNTFRMKCVHSQVIFTALKRSLRRLCIYRCLSVHRGHALQGGVTRGVYGRGDMHGHCGAAGVCAARGCTWPGACLAGGMHGSGGHTWQGACMAGERAWPGGVCVLPPQADTRTYSQCSGGTHPTGMHSYYRLQTKFGAR